MKISMVASGSRGDVQPYIALGQGLKHAGYDVRLLTSDDFETLVTDAGLAFGSMGQSIETTLQSDDWRKVTESGNFVAILGKMRGAMQDGAAKLARQMPGLLGGSDLIVTGMPGLTGVFSIADKLNIPVIQAYVFPFTPTNEFPSPLVPKLPFGRALNRLSFQVMRQMLWQSFKLGDTTIRRALGLAKGSFWGPYQALQAKQVPVLYGYSRHVLPRPSDWDALNQVTGYWFLDAPDDWRPPADLVDFLNAGDPPVYIGFGSMGNRNPAAAGQIALEALQRSGQRGILASGWGGLQASDLPATVQMVASIPHSWLFPQMAAVVHHGGAGTTAAGLRAGVPSIIIPFFGDQPFWGQRVATLGVGTAPIPRKRLTSERLGQAIRDAVSDSALRQRAHALGQSIRAEDGIAQAVAYIQQHSARR
ncbi:MAG: glycosyltransferase family 1 protein [Armatimonadetes bacterium]|nr:glycosyltransferase family 1 protein [Anaerolineae bacterium]